MFYGGPNRTQDAKAETVGAIFRLLRRLRPKGIIGRTLSLFDAEQDCCECAV
jgi:hypothetical protein